MSPYIELLLHDIGKHFIVVLGKSGGEILGSHHVYVVFVRADRGDSVSVLAAEAVAEEISHQRANGESDRIRVLRGKSFIYIRQKIVRVFSEYLRRKLVTGSPVVNIREKGICKTDTFIEVPHL